MQNQKFVSKQSLTLVQLKQATIVLMPKKEKDFIDRSYLIFSDLLVETRHLFFFLA